MTNLPNPTPVAVPVLITEDQARAVLEGVEPGWYRARDLHPRYAALAEARGWPVGDAKKLGEALRRLGLPTRRVHGNTSAYQVNG